MASNPLILIANDKCFHCKLIRPHPYQNVRRIFAYFPQVVAVRASSIWFDSIYVRGLFPV